MGKAEEAIGNAEEVGFSNILYAVDPTGWAQAVADGPGFGPLQALAVTFFLFLLLLVYKLWLQRIWPLQSYSKDLHMLIGALNDEFPDVREGEPVDDPDSWPRVRAIIKEHADWLSEAYHEFDEQCWTDSKNRRRNAHQAAEYFSADIVGPGHADFGAVVPGLLTAVGILGTFVGITVGLNLVEVADQKEIEASIENLIQALGVSFRTSIWGLLLSMLATWRLSRWESEFESARIALMGWLDSAHDRGTEHDLLQSQLRILEEISGLAVDQNGEIQVIGGHIHTVLENLLLGKPQSGGGRSGGLAGVIKEGQKEVAALISEGQTQGVSNMTENFANKLEEMFSGQFGNLADSIGTMVEANDQYQATMGDLVSKLESSTDAQGEAAEKVTEAVQMASEAITEINDTVGKLSDSAEAIRDASTDVGSVLKGQGDLATEQQKLSKELLGGLEAQRTGWAEHQRAIQETYTSMEGKFDGLSDALQGLTEWHDKIKDELSKNLASWQAALTLQQGLTETIADERTHWTAMLTSLETTTASIKTLGVGLETLAVKLKDDIVAVSTDRSASNEELEKLAKELGNAGTGINESLGEYLEGITALTAGLPDITKMLDGIQQSVTMQQQMIEGVGKVVTEAGKVSAEMKLTADGQEAIRTSFEAVAAAGEATREALEPTATAIKDGADALGGAVAGLTAVHGSSEELAEQLKTSTEQLQAANTEAHGSWNSITDQVEQTSKDLNQGMQEYSRQVNAGVTTALRSFDDGLAKGVADLGRALTALADTVDHLESIVTRQDE